MNVDDKVYRLGNNSIKTRERKSWLYQLMFNLNNSNNKIVCMQTPFDTIMCSKRYTAHYLMAIKEFIDNGHTLIDSSAITSDKFNRHGALWFCTVLLIKYQMFSCTILGKKRVSLNKYKH